jgi:hypothetical protein
MSVTRRQPSASTITVVSRNGVARASTNPTTQSITPVAARAQPRAFIVVGRPAGIAARTRDKLVCQEASL